MTDFLHYDIDFSCYDINFSHYYSYLYDIGRPFILLATHYGIARVFYSLHSYPPQLNCRNLHRGHTISQCNQELLSGRNVLKYCGAFLEPLLIYNISKIANLSMV